MTSAKPRIDSAVQKFNREETEAGPDREPKEVYVQTKPGLNKDSSGLGLIRTKLRTKGSQSKDKTLQNQD